MKREVTYFKVEEVCECGWPWLLSITKKDCAPEVCCGGKKVERIIVSEEK